MQHFLVIVGRSARTSPMLRMSDVRSLKSIIWFVLQFELEIGAFSRLTNHSFYKWDVELWFGISVFGLYFRFRFCILYYGDNRQVSSVLHIRRLGRLPPDGNCKSGKFTQLKLVKNWQAYSYIHKLCKRSITIKVNSQLCEGVVQ